MSKAKSNHGLKRIVGMVECNVVGEGEVRKRNHSSDITSPDPSWTFT